MPATSAARIERNAASRRTGAATAQSLSAARGGRVSRENGVPRAGPSTWLGGAQEKAPQPAHRIADAGAALDSRPHRGQRTVSVAGTGPRFYRATYAFRPAIHTRAGAALA